VLHCRSGFEARAAGEIGLVAKVQRHAWEAHSMALTDEEALLLAFRAQLHGKASTASPREPTHTEQEET
jgi:hypothetical protein